MNTKTQPQDLPPATSADLSGSGLAPLTIVRTETILSKLPIHNLTKNKKIDIQIARLDPKGKVELKWEISYSERYGQARQLAYKLDTIVVNRRIDEAGKPLPQIIRLGSLNEMCAELGSQKDEVKRAIQQNATTSINAIVTYRGNDGTERRLETLFTRYSVVFTGQKLPGGEKADAIYIILNEPYREVLNNAPVRPLNYDYLKELSPAPQRFYEIVSYKIFAALKHDQPFAKLSYCEYCMFSAQQRYFDYDRFKKQMYKIHRPHLKSGYIASVHYEQAVDGDGKRDWIMCYAPGPKACAEYKHFTGKKAKISVSATSIADSGGGRGRRKPPSPLPSPIAADDPLLKELTNRGIDAAPARKLLAEIQANPGPDNFQTLDTLEWGDYQIAAQPGKFNNPPGFYISLLQGRVEPPAAFETSRRKSARLEAELALQSERERLHAEREILELEARRLDEERLANLPAGQYEKLRAKVVSDLKARYPKAGFDGNTLVHADTIHATMLFELRRQS